MFNYTLWVKVVNGCRMVKFSSSVPIQMGDYIWLDNDQKKKLKVTEIRHSLHNESKVRETELFVA